MRGDSDFVFDGSCYSWHRCPDGGCRGEDVMYVHHAVEDACAQIEASFCLRRAAFDVAGRIR